MDDVSRDSVTAKTISSQIETDKDGVKLTEMPDRVIPQEVFPTTFGDNLLTYAIAFKSMWLEASSSNNKAGYRAVSQPRQHLP